MNNLKKAQKALGKIKVIAIVDDLEENRSAAQIAVQNIFPDTEVRIFSSEKEIISAMQASNEIPYIDLVLTDMSMEEKYSGVHVAQECATWFIPCIPVTGGVKTHTTDQVLAGGAFPSESIIIHGEKDNYKVWEIILKKSLLEQDFSNALIKMLYYGKREQDESLRVSGIAFCTGALS